jgi:penicillin-binding protein 1C
MIALDPDIPRGRQEIAFVANASARGSRWTLDRQDLGPVSGVKLWAPVPGIHTLALVGSNGKPFDLLTFKVRGAMAGETSADLHD